MEGTKIGIVGAGFSGSMTAIHIIRKVNEPVEIFLIDRKDRLAKGIAYSPYSSQVLLNVKAGKMSAFDELPDHFVDWLQAVKAFPSYDKKMLQNAFVSRRLYGEYLEDIWKFHKELARKKGITVHFLDEQVMYLEQQNKLWALHLSNHKILEVECCVLATGNHLPGNAILPDLSFRNNKAYFQNPWDERAVTNVSENLPTLIIGNGLTMVDTVIGLQEKGFTGKIISISPNGFSILPHDTTPVIDQIIFENFQPKITLLDAVRLINKNAKKARKLGYSIVPVIDGLRKQTQAIWKGFTAKEKQLFMNRCRHMWGVARHRIPIQMFDRMNKLRKEGILEIRAGKIIALKNSSEGIECVYEERGSQVKRDILVGRVINCTGPETNLSKLDNHFLKDLFERGIVTQDPLNLGIATNTKNYRVKNRKEEEQVGLYTLGSNLKGELWESTAVNELRVQAEELATEVLLGIKKPVEYSTDFL